MEEIEWGKAGLNSQDVSRGAREAVGGPSLDLVLKGGELSRHVYSGLESVCAVAEDEK